MLKLSRELMKKIFNWKTSLYKSDKKGTEFSAISVKMNRAQKCEGREMEGMIQLKPTRLG